MSDQAQSDIGQVGVVINLREEKPSDKHTTTILDKASGNALKAVLLMAYNDAGEVYFDTNIDDAGDILYLLKLAEHKVMQSALSGGSKS